MFPILSVLLNQKKVVGLLVVVMLLQACSDSNKNSSLVFEELNETLERSNKNIMDQNGTVYKLMQEKLQVIETAEKASIWYPIAASVKEKSKQITYYIEELKFELKNESELNIGAKKAFSEKNSKEAVSLFLKQEKDKELFFKLKKYREELISISPAIRTEFGEMIHIVNNRFGDSISVTQFENDFFRNDNIFQLLAVLSGFQNNVVLSENKLVAFCNNRIVSGFRICNQNSALISLSSNCVEAGETIKIEAGIGFYKWRAMPEINIKGEKVKVKNGVGVYNYKVQNNPGNYKLPVKIDFTDQDGKKQTVIEYVAYKVVEKE